MLTAPSPEGGAAMVEKGGVIQNRAGREAQPASGEPKVGEREGRAGRSMSGRRGPRDVLRKAAHHRIASRSAARQAHAPRGYSQGGYSIVHRRGRLRADVRAGVRELTSGPPTGGPLVNSLTFAVMHGGSGWGLRPHPLPPMEFLLRQPFQFGSARLHVGILHRAVQVDRVAIGLFELIRMQRAVVHRVNRR